MSPYFPPISLQVMQTGPCTSGMPATANYNSNNQLTSALYHYDPAGNVTIDPQNQYLYDGDGRICAVYGTTMPGITSMTGYLYDADGTRVAKGAISVWSCDPTISGFVTTNDYILGPSGEQVTEMGVGGAFEGSTTSGLVWQHTNVWAGGKLLATYDGDTVSGTNLTGGMHFYFDDPLGSRRVQTDYAGNIEKSCSNLPYGDGETCAPTPTEHLFTGKERDSESGNDYFDARYYSSAMGRFMSPDWAAKASPVPYATFGDPQSLNLYAYVRNNPLTRVDADGHCCEDGSTADRLLTLTVGTINLYVSVNKGLGAVAEAATAETGVGALVALYTGNQAVNQGAGGIRQIFGAFTGNTKDANDYADNLTIHSSLLGAGALLVTKNKDLALGAAAAEGIASTTVVKKLPEVIDAGMNALQVLTSAKPNAPAQPPPQPAPPAPPQPPPPPPPPQKPPAQ